MFAAICEFVNSNTQCRKHTLHIHIAEMQHTLGGRAEDRTGK